MLETFSVRSIIIIHPSGLIIYHKSFSKELVDEHLFSGFVAAILAFSKELGSELSSIGLQNKLFFFDRIHSLIFVLSMDTEVNKRSIEEFFLFLKNAKEIEDLADNIQSKVVFPLAQDEIQETDELIMHILMQYGISEDKLEGEMSSADDLKFIKEITDELRSMKTTPKEIAERIFGVGFSKKDPSYIKEKITILQTFLDSGHVHKSLEKSLNKLVKYLERTSKSATLFGF
ncbi:MAG: hypothetical protein ACFE95_08365 [Candidatus Hodarchaeota archaeon]